MENCANAFLKSARYFGQEKEREARVYLEKQGLIFVKSNYNCKCGEIDLIMEDCGVIVFLEVRYRKNKYYGSGLESITRNKRRKIIKTANYYLMAEKKQNRQCRFDVVTFGGEGEELEWIRDAFWA